MQLFLGLSSNGIIEHRELDIFHVKSFVLFRTVTKFYLKNQEIATEIFLQKMFSFFQELYRSIVGKVSRRIVLKNEEMLSFPVLILFSREHFCR